MKKKRSKHLMRKIAGRRPQAKVDQHVEEQFVTGRLYGEGRGWEREREG